MGQIHSDEYQCDNGTTADVADLEINSKEPTPKQEGAKSITASGQQHSTAMAKNQQQQDARCSSGADNKFKQHQQQQHARKLSNVSHRNIQLLSMRPRSEKDAYAEDLRQRRRSSLINLILGAPSSGPRFSDDLCSLSSHMSECMSNFGIEFFPDLIHTTTSISSLRLESFEDIEKGNAQRQQQTGNHHKRRRSSLSNLAAQIGRLNSLQLSDNPAGVEASAKGRGSISANGQRDGSGKKLAPSVQATYQARKQQQFRKTSLASTLASIDLTSSFEQNDKSMRNGGNHQQSFFRPPLCKAKDTIFESASQESVNDLKLRLAKGRVNQTGRVLRRTGSELSLYSSVSAGSGAQGGTGGASQSSIGSTKQPSAANNCLRETKLIIMLQVCLPFILAGFGNMAAGLVLNRVAQWTAFRHVPIFFVLLPPFVGLKGNIEMTLASRLSTLSNLNLLDTGYQRRRAYMSNLILILSQAIGLSMFAAFVSILCELSMSSVHHKLPEAGVGAAKFSSGNVVAGELFEIAFLVVLASALATSIVLVIMSSIIISLSIGLANLLQVNPDNLSTLIAALYGDVSCVLIYGLIADWMFSLREQNIIIWPLLIIISTLLIWPVTLYAAYKFKETNRIALSSMPPMLTSIVVSMGSGAILSLVIDRFRLIALYQPVVNGFGANLIAVQASRVSTWLWCSELRKMAKESVVEEAPKKSIGSLASFTSPHAQASPIQKPTSPNPLKILVKLIRTLLWSFCNSSPNSIAARLLLVMLIPAQTIYFFVIWLLSPINYVVITWQFYSAYMGLCIAQVLVLLTLCEPLMTLLMSRNLDPDIFGISLLMALADLTGTLCLTGAFFFLASIGDINALV